MTLKTGMAANAQRVLYVVGLGVRIPGHTTIAATEALSRCGRIYSIVQEPPGLWLPPGRTPPPTVINLMSLYVEGALRSDNYARVAKTILDGLNDVPVIGYVTYGNPLCYDSVAQTLAREAAHADCQLEVVPGISSIDAILCDLRLDMAPGIQIYEASWLVGSRTPLNASVAAILLQLGHFGSLRAHYRERRPAESLADLVAYLCGFYPPSHTVYLVQSSSGPQPASVAPVRLEELSRVGEQDWAESVYIPAIRQPQLSPEVAARMAGPRMSS